MLMFASSLIAARVAVAVSSVAFAQGTPQQRAACRPDVAKFCKGKGEDPGVLLTCLEDNKDKISEKCRKVIGETSSLQKIGASGTPRRDEIVRSRAPLDLVEPRAQPRHREIDEGAQLRRRMRAARVEQMHRRFLAPEFAASTCTTAPRANASTAW